MEAYHHLSQVVEQVNAIMGSFFAGERMEDDLRWREEREKRLAQRKDAQASDADAATAPIDEDEDFQEKDDEDIYFAPEKGNVIFASAIDGWGFRIGKFAQLYAKKLGMKEANLRRVLWGDYYLDPKTKRVIGYKHLKGRALKPLFVQFVLENIWAVYDGVVSNPCVHFFIYMYPESDSVFRNPDKVQKIVTALDLKILPRDLKSKDPRQLLGLIFGQWLSLSTCTIQTIIDVIPPPSAAQAIRIPKMLHPDVHTYTLEPKDKLERDLFSCDPTPDATIVAYTSKMFAVARADLPENKRRPLTAQEMRDRGRELRHQGEDAIAGQQSAEGSSDGQSVPLDKAKEETKEVPEKESDTVILGFARLYSGVLRTGSSIYCVLPKYNSAVSPTHHRNQSHIVKAKVEGLYVMMGRDLEPVETVKAGNVFAIRGLEGKVWRNATLCAPSANTGLAANIDSDRESIINLGGILRQVSSVH